MKTYICPNCTQTVEHGKVHNCMVPKVQKKTPSEPPLEESIEIYDVEDHKSEGGNSKYRTVLFTDFNISPADAQLLAVDFGGNEFCIIDLDNQVDKLPSANHYKEYLRKVKPDQVIKNDL